MYLHMYIMYVPYFHSVMHTSRSDFSEFSHFIAVINIKVSEKMFVSRLQKIGFTSA